MAQSTDSHPSAHWLQVAPAQLPLHMHILGAVHLPLLHDDEQMATAQVGPVHPALQAQVLAAVQLPLLLQLLAHIGVRQSDPVHPSQHNLPQTLRSKPGMSGQA